LTVSSVAAWSESLRPSVVDAFGSPTHWTMQQGRSGWREPTDGEAWSRAIVAFEDGQPVAVASAFHPALHPSREWSYVEVSPARRGRGHGARALEELDRVLPSTAGPLRAKVWAGSAGDRFASAHGFQPVQRTRLVRVSAAGRVRPHPRLRGAVVGLGALMDDEIVQAWSDHYTAGHDWDPPCPLSLPLCRELFFTGDQCVVLAVDRRQIAGIALLRATVTGITTFTGGAVSRVAPNALEIATELLATSSRVVSGPLHIELDDWMWEIDQAIGTTRREVVDDVHVVVRPRARYS
jgi:GNAT superfamily N-acetyltransferase